MNVTEAIKIARLTDVGLHRDHNEDAVASDLSIGFLVLADGMGGYKAGEIASEIAVLSLMAEMAEAMHHAQPVEKTAEILKQMVLQANNTIYNIAQTHSQCAGMGTTLVASVFVDNKFVVAHVGDSRMYRLRSGLLTQLTEDHSLLQEQINMGLISKDQAKYAEHKNLVTRALGIDAKVEVDLEVYEVEVGDIYLACSDGLTDMIDDEDILAVMSEGPYKLEKMASRLVTLANEAGGKDNCSVILAHVQQEFPLKKSTAKKWVKNLFGNVQPARK